MVAHFSDEQLTACSARMKKDWNERAEEDAKWFINTVSRNQSEAEFFESGRREVSEWWLPDFRDTLQGRDLSQLKVFEFGCGIGRMTSHLAEHFGELWAADVSGEMVAQGRERFAHLPNLRWLEIDGIELTNVPDDYFDLIFSLYVFQHVPSKEAVAQAIASAYRKLKPGGFLKVHTNGLVLPDYDAVAKDTWQGTTFSEAEVRQLVVALGGQLIGLFGGTTPYCWATIKKPELVAPAKYGEPAIVAAGWAEDLSVAEIPVSGDQATLALLVTGLDQATADCNSVRVIIAGESCLPRYVGIVRRHQVAFVPVAVLKAQIHLPLAQLTYLEVNLPAGLAAGTVNVALTVAAQPFPAQLSVRLTDGSAKRPKIVTARNAVDFGMDIYAQGEKSRLHLHVYGLDETAHSGNVRVRLNELELVPDFAGFVMEDGNWQVHAALPVTAEPGDYELKLVFKSVESEAVPILLR